MKLALETEPRRHLSGLLQAALSLQTQDVRWAKPRQREYHQAQ